MRKTFEELYQEGADRLYGLGYTTGSAEFQKVKEAAERYAKQAVLEVFEEIEAEMAPKSEGEGAIAGVKVKFYIHRKRQEL